MIKSRFHRSGFFNAQREPYRAIPKHGFSADPEVFSLLCPFPKQDLEISDFLLSFSKNFP